jgi:hypothetical protein
MDECASGPAVAGPGTWSGATLYHGVAMDKKMRQTRYEWDYHKEKVSYQFDTEKGEINGRLGEPSLPILGRGTSPGSQTFSPCTDMGLVSEAIFIISLLLTIHVHQESI